jgi:hypothetical protein
MKESKFHHAGPHLPVKNLRETLTYYCAAVHRMGCMPFRCPHSKMV